MDKEAKVTKEFRESLKQTLKNTATVTDQKPKVTIEMKRLDSFTTGEEVLSAIAQLLSASQVDVKVRLTVPDAREQRRAFIDLANVDANNFLKVGRVLFDGRPFSQ